MHLNEKSGTTRTFSHTRFIILLAVALQLEIPESAIIYKKYFGEDLIYCHHCFEQQIESCTRFYATLNYNSNGTNLIDSLLNFLRAGNKRTTAVLHMNDSTHIVAKRFGKYRPPREVLKSPVFAVKWLLQRFSDDRSLDGFQLCPSKSVARFVAAMLQQQVLYDLNELTIMLYMMDNVQPLLLPVLYARGWPWVPKTLARCGYTHYEAYAGKPLIEYYKAPTIVKLRIAQQLLKMVLQFTEGFDGFRMYITDLTGDNLVYNDDTHQLSIVDLNTLLIVDSNAFISASSRTTHKHEFIECLDCFAYVPEEICSHHRSDLNLFAACQFLREDLRRNTAGGFLNLYSISNYSYLAAQLNACVNCEAPNCNNRFEVVHILIETIDVILSN